MEYYIKPIYTEKELKDLYDTISESEIENLVSELNDYYVERCAKTKVLASSVDLLHREELIKQIRNLDVDNKQLVQRMSIYCYENNICDKKFKYYKLGFFYPLLCKYNFDLFP